MDPERGRIYDGTRAMKLPSEVRKRLVPLSIGEIVVVKGCWFKIEYIRTDRSSITLKGIPKPKEE